MSSERPQMPLTRWSIGDLEAVVAFSPDPGRRATAYAALTHMRILSHEWTHVVATRDASNRIVGHMTIKKPSGETSGKRTDVEDRLTMLFDELTCRESH